MPPLALLGLLWLPVARVNAADVPAVQRAAAQALKTMGASGAAVDWPAAPAAAPTQADPQIDVACEKLQSPIPWEYCLTRTKGSESDEVLYFMHGVGGDARIWGDPAHFTAQVRRAWAKAGKQAPIVAAVSFGPFWLLSEKNPSSNSGLLDLVTGVAIPTIERNLGGGPRRRLLMGESMGGFNATMLVLKAPGFFERAALVCPAIASVSPYSAPADIQAYTQRTHADPGHVTEEIRLAKAVFPDEASWQKAAPLTIGRSLLGPATPPLNVSCGDKDEYGFFEGAGLFADLAKSQGVNATFETIPGQGHCASDPQALADFLLP